MHCNTGSVRIDAFFLVSNKMILFVYGNCKKDLLYYKLSFQFFPSKLHLKMIFHSVMFNFFLLFLYYTSGAGTWGRHGDVLGSQAVVTVQIMYV